MDLLHRVCMFVAGVCLVVITIIIPWSVFTRYVLNYGSSWPEPLAVLLMIWFSFTAAALCYRKGCTSASRSCRWCCTACVCWSAGWSKLAMAGGMNLFMLIWGVRLVHTTWFQVIADFPLISVRISYLPVPIRRRDHAAVRRRAAMDGAAVQGPPTTDWRPWASSRSCRSDLRMDLVILIGGFALLCPRHAGRLRARARGRACGALDRHPARGGDAESPTAPTTSRCSRSPSSSSPAASWRRADLAERLVNLAKVFVSFIRGLALVNILASAFFGCSPARPVADTASIGTMMVPQMEKNGYPRAVRRERIDLRGLAQPAVRPYNARNLFAPCRRHGPDHDHSSPAPSQAFSWASV